MPPRDPDLRREQSHHPREFADLVYAYPVVSRRSGGVSLGVNLNIDKHCNFDCPYCQVDRTAPKPKQAIDVDAVRAEVSSLLSRVDADGVMRIEKFAGLSDGDKRLKDVAVSGDGEPTMIPEFEKVCDALAELQASHRGPDFKLILITNSTMLDRESVLRGIGRLLSKSGEVWAKLDAGTEEWYQKINISRVSLDRIEANLIKLGERHPFAVQSMFCGIDGTFPDRAEVDAYLERLRRVNSSGARITEVQLYTLARKPSVETCAPVTPEFLRALRARIESEAGLPARVYGVAA